MDASHRYFCNDRCQYFPCHQGLAPHEFNCLFCFCPLYFLTACGGNHTWRQGVKDCSACLKPHRPGGYDQIMAQLRQELELRRGKNQNRETLLGSTSPAPEPE